MSFVNVEWTNGKFTHKVKHIVCYLCEVIYIDTVRGLQFGRGEFSVGFKFCFSSWKRTYLDLCLKKKKGH